MWATKSHHVFPQAYNRLMAGQKGVIFTDASKDRGKSWATVTVTTTEKLLTCATVKTNDVDEAEELAIALALTIQGRTRVVTDSQQAYRSFQSGWVSRLVLRALKGKELPKGEEIELIWVPAHSAVEGNEFAHQQARALSHRAAAAEREEEDAKSQPLVTYKDIVEYYRNGRQSFPEPHLTLTREQQTTYRQIQTESFPHPRLLNRMYPSQYGQECPVCHEPGTLQHMIAECKFSQQHPPLLTNPNPNMIPLPIQPLRERWKILLSSPALEDQLWLVTRGQAARAAYGFP